MELIGSMRARSKRFGGSNYWVLIFTKESLIVAKSGDSGFLAFGPVGVVVGSLAIRNKTEKLKEMAAEDLLNENKANFEIKYSDITEVRMNKPRVFSFGGIELDTPDNKYKFEFRIKKMFDQYVDLVRSVLGEKTITNK